MNVKHTALPLVLAVVGLGCATPAGDSATSGHQDLDASQCAAATPWAAWVAYSVGQLVTYDGTTYQCVQAHTSEPGWTPDVVAALWQPVTCSGSGSGGGSG